MVANLRRGSTGRRLIAVRTNERAAAALGINVLANKVYAFALSAMVAGLAGVLYAYQSTNIVYGTTFGGTLSISLVTFAVIGGIGYIGGAFIGALLVPGGIGARFGNELFDNFGPYLPLVAGVLLLVNLLQAPDGLARLNIDMFTALVRRVRRGDAKAPAGSPAMEQSDTHTGVNASSEDVTKQPAAVEVDAVSVRFGGVQAVNGASLRLETGRVTGLIGPNGAGKSTLIDAITGFARIESGDVRLNGRSERGRPPHWWARAGVSRSFQSLELFEDLTLAENLLVAYDDRRWTQYVTTLMYSRRTSLPVAVLAAVREFRLEAYLDTQVKAMPYGARRLAAIARAIATEPSLLLLDEPAAGLSDDESAELAVVLRRLVDQQGIGVLVVEHDMNFVMGLCDEVVVLNFGEVIFSGPPEAARKSQSVVDAYLGEEDDSNASAVVSHGARPGVPSR
jgi:sulfate-transporting ATPase